MFALTIVFAVVATGTSTASSAPARAATASAPAEPHWVYQMINDFNLGISAPSGILAASYTNYIECAKGPAAWTYIEGNSVVMENEVRTQFAESAKLIPGWVAQIAK